ncbi:MAG: DnaJ domain-containing protein [Pseudobdellovibrionaceae bacterium]
MSHMNKPSEFANILEKAQQRRENLSKTSAEKLTEHDSQSEFTLQKTENFLLQQLLARGELHPFRFCSSQKTTEKTISKFNRWNLSSSFQTKKMDSSPQSPMVSHQLNALQQQAFQLMNDYDGKLSPSFTLKELKKSYRVLAMKHHPDRSQDKRSEIFIGIRSAYKTLLGIFTQPLK